MCWHVLPAKFEGDEVLTLRPERTERHWEAEGSLEKDWSKKSWIEASQFGVEKDWLELRWKPI